MIRLTPGKACRGSVHILVVSDVHAGPDLGVSTARSCGSTLGAETKEVEQTISLGRLLELALGLPEGGSVLLKPSATGARAGERGDIHC